MLSLREILNKWWMNSFLDLRDSGNMKTSFRAPVIKNLKGQDFCRWIVGVPYLFSRFTPYQINTWSQMFSPILQVTFHSINCSLCYEAFSVLCSITSLFLWPVLLVLYPWNHCQKQCHEAFSRCFSLGVLQFQISSLSLYLWYDKCWQRRGETGILVRCCKMVQPPTQEAMKITQKNWK